MNQDMEVDVETLTQTRENTFDRIRKTIAAEAQTLLRLSERVDRTSVAVVEQVLRCTGRVIVVGMGKSGLVGRKMAATFCSTGTPAFFLHPVEACHGDLGIVAPDDIAIALSSSGETEEVLNLLPQLKRLGVLLISITGQRKSSLGTRSDLVLEIEVEQEADPLGVAPMCSTTAMLAMGDALAAALVEARGFTREQFASFHPGGHLGRKLLLYVRDLMHDGDTLPVVQSDLPLRAAICEMSDKRLGAIIVADDSGTMEGIFTDGDLRRLLEKNDNPLSMRVGDAMTLRPKTTYAGCLAAEALHEMQQRAVSVLPVLDETQKVVGAIHLHDLVRAGLA
ncbi:KpsF/GutQ family sugar-phosphate isomerase [Planctomycetaceae bacterium SH139]